MRDPLSSCETRHNDAGDVVLSSCVASGVAECQPWPIATVEAVNHFTGTARFYAEFRPGYPGDLWESLATQAVVDGSSKALDLGSGPATATLELAKLATAQPVQSHTGDRPG